MQESHGLSVATGLGASSRLSAARRKNYGGALAVEGSSLPCYTTRQMKSLYPVGGHHVVAELVTKGPKEAHESKQPGLSLEFDGREIPLSPLGSTSRLTYRTAGYIAVEGADDMFVVVREGMALYRALCLVLALVVLVVAALAILGGEASPSINPDLDPNAAPWTGEPQPEQSEIPADGIRLPGYKSITVQSGVREVSVALRNPEENNCYLVMRLVLPDSGETIFESKMIEPGKGLYNVTLARPLKAGKYDAQLHYDAYDMTTLARLNGAVINLDLIAE